MLGQKIRFLDRVCSGTLCITHYTQWSVTSYGDGTPLSAGNSVNGDTLDEALDKAINQIVGDLTKNGCFIG